MLPENPTHFNPTQLNLFAQIFSPEFFERYSTFDYFLGTVRAQLISQCGPKCREPIQRLALAVKFAADIQTMELSWCIVLKWNLRGWLSSRTPDSLYVLETSR